MEINQSTDSTNGSIVSEGRLENGLEARVVCVCVCVCGGGGG